MAGSEVDIRAFVAGEEWQVVDVFDGWTWNFLSKIKAGDDLRYDGLKLQGFGDLLPNIVRKQRLERMGYV